MKDQNDLIPLRSSYPLPVFSDLTKNPASRQLNSTGTGNRHVRKTKKYMYPYWKFV
jgi:hypothetical protein